MCISKPLSGTATQSESFLRRNMAHILFEFLLISQGILTVLAVTQTAIIGRVPTPVIPSNFPLTTNATKSGHGCQSLCLQRANCEISVFDEKSRSCQLGNLRNWNGLQSLTTLVIDSQNVYFYSGNQIRSFG